MGDTVCRGGNLPPETYDHHRCPKDALHQCREGNLPPETYDPHRCPMDALHPYMDDRRFVNRPYGGNGIAIRRTVEDAGPYKENGVRCV